MKNEMVKNWQICRMHDVNEIYVDVETVEVVNMTWTDAVKYARRNYDVTSLFKRGFTIYVR